MQNDLKISLNTANSKQIFMIIGQQRAGKTLFITKFSQSKQQAVPDSKITEFDIDLIDTPSYDSFFTLLPYRDPTVTGYIIMFSQYNTEILKSIKQIRKKLFSLNGQHKRTIVMFNEFQQMDNFSSQIDDEIINIKDWCKLQDILFMKYDIQKLSKKDIFDIFEKIFSKKQRITILLYIFLLFQFIYPLFILFFDIWLSVNDPSIIISNISLEIYCLLLLSLAILHFFIPYYLRKGIQDQDKTCIFKSKIVSGVVTTISLISLFLAIFFNVLVTCLIMSIIYTVNSLICLFITLKQ